MVFIVEARHRVVGLRLQPGARDPPGGERLEDRKAAAAGEAVDQRGDEDGLAGARQAGDAEPDRRIEKVLAIVQQRPRRQARFLDDIVKSWGPCGREELGSAEAMTANTIRKVAIGGRKSSFILRTRLEPRGLNAFVDLARRYVLSLR